jgi:hypothetical protein
MKALGVTSLLLVAGLIAFAGIIAALDSNPLRRSEGQIRQWVMQKTPLGSSREEVMAAIAKEPWLGHPKFGGVGTPPSVTDIDAKLGSYQGFPWYCRVDAYWSFDSQGKLTDVHVIRGCDSL